MFFELFDYGAFEGEFYTPQTSALAIRTPELWRLRALASGHGGDRGSVFKAPEVHVALKKRAGLPRYNEITCDSPVFHGDARARAGSV